MRVSSRFRGIIAVGLLLAIVSIATAKYSGGTGEPNDPYQIATAADLIALGETPEDYDKHFILTADIDLDPNLPGGKVFDRAVIAPDANDTEKGVQGTPFTGVIDGNGHTISNLTIVGGGYLGLVGWLVRSEPCGQLLRLGVVDVNISGSGECISGLVGYTYGGTVTNCYSTGVVRGGGAVGGLVGRANVSSITASYSTGAVSGLYSIGGLVGVNNHGDVTQCYSIVSVTGERSVGGLVGSHSGYWFRGWLYGAVFQCRSAGTVRGYSWVGGLIGSSYPSETPDCGGLVKQCCSSATVAGEQDVGGLVGINLGVVADSYCTGTVSGTGGVGGLVGYTESGYCLRSPAGDAPSVTRCYSTGNVAGTSGVGGLVAQGEPRWGGEIICYSFWDIQTSGQSSSVAGTGKMTAEMQTAGTFLEASWDFVGETTNGSEDIWKIAEGIGYPRLAWQKYSGGTGEPNDPYQIATADDLIALGETPDDYDKHFILTADIDLDPNLPGRKVFDKAVIAPDTDPTLGKYGLRYINPHNGTPFTGTFDGDGHTISRLMVTGGSYLGLFGSSGAEVRDLGVVGIYLIGSGARVGGLVGKNWGTVVRCYSTGTVKGDDSVGGLVGGNSGGGITASYSTASVIGNARVGGLLGDNGCLVLTPGQTISVDACHSTGTVSGVHEVGGLVGRNLVNERISHSYSTSAVIASEDVGGLVGLGLPQCVTASFWDIQSSGQATSDGGTGKTMAEMQTAATFLEAGWDFVGETANGTEDIWWILEGKDYPRLWWEPIPEN